MLRKKCAKSTCSTLRKKFRIFLIITVLLQLSALKSYAELFNGDTAAKVDFYEMAQNLRAGQVVILSEQHGLEAHHQNQRDFLVKISGASFPISVGMEFFSYPEQPAVDAYLANEITEDVFLKAVKWGSIPFLNYRFQVRFPYWRGGKTLALNLPREISGKVSKNGLDSLTSAEKALLPPQLVLGNADYFERFTEAMQGHIKDPTVLQNYFTAHCLWDETMAWKAKEYLQLHPEQLLAIIVGDFHVAYEDGLVARLRDQGVVTTVISQVTDLADVTPHPKYGRRADFVWTP
jgi:uncharacterized iron-regulated protein